METRFVISDDGVRTAYDVTGTGPALMLIHGAGKTRRDWHRLGYVRRLSERFRVITVDVRGTGESDIRTDPADYGVEKICADLTMVADACQARRFAIWGYSFGGTIARCLGAWSDRSTAIAVIGVPFGPAVDPEFDRYIDEFMARYAHLAQESPAGTSAKDSRRATIKGGISVWMACFPAMRLWPAIEPQQLRCPALIVAGSKNTRATHWIDENREALDRAGVQVAVLPGLDHPKEFTQIEQVYPVVTTFLAHSVQSPRDSLERPANA